MSSAFGNCTFLLTPGLLSWATSLTDRWEVVQLGHHKGFLGAYWADPRGGKLSNNQFRGKSSSLSLGLLPSDHLAGPLPVGLALFYLSLFPTVDKGNRWVNQCLHFFSSCDYENFPTYRKVGRMVQHHNHLVSTIAIICHICLICLERERVR